MSVVNRQKLSFYPYNVDLHTAMPFTSQSMGKNSLVWSVFVQSIQDFTDSHHPLSQVIVAFKLLSSKLTSSLITVLLVAPVKTTVWLFSQYVVFDIHVPLPSDVQLKPYPLRGTRGSGGWGWWTPPPLEFLISCNILKQFCLQWNAFDLLYKTRYILWAVVLLEVS